ncbi:MAG: GDP-mannose 4,6-dehydratase [Dehalococcoidia bacterium]|nr:GDP-mannose 4,6-dehydratase [Dehalococcoidia bacterium]
MINSILDWYRGRKVLVTGGAGFIGSHMVEKLLDLGAEVRVIDTMLCGNKIEHLDDRDDLYVHKLDVMDSAAIAPLFEGIDIVFHLAAMVGVEETQDEPVTLLNVEIVGTSNVIALAAKNRIKRFVFASSSEVYGDSWEPMVEEGPFNPKSSYALTKLIGEHYCRAYYQKYGLEYTALRYFNSYGPRQDDRFVMSRFINRAMSGKDLLVYGDGTQTRDFTFVDDSVIMSLLAGASVAGINQVLNFGTGKAVSINTLADMVLTGIGLRGQVKVSFIDYDKRRSRAIEVFSRIANVDRAEKLLGYRPVTALEGGMKICIDWFLSRRT